MAHRSLVFALSIVVCSAGCSGCGEDSTVFVRCPKIELDRSSAQPFDLIRLDLRPTKKLSELEVKLNAADAQFEVGLDKRSDEEVYLFLPTHPDGIEGGAATLEFSFKGKQCDSIDFTVEPLPEAPGTAEKMLGAFQEVLDASLSGYGLAADTDLIAAVEVVDDEVVVDLPRRAFHVGFLQYIFDHPDNSSSLVTAVDGMNDDDLREFDAVIAKLNVIEWLEFERDSLLSAEIAWLSTDTPPSAESVSDAQPEITTCSQLLATIWSGRRSCNVGRAFGNKLTGAGLVDSFALVGLRNGVEKLAGEAAADAAGAASWLAAAAFFGTAGALATWSKYRCATLPSSASGFRVETTNLRIPEDRRDSTGFSGVRIDAESGPATSLAASVVDLIATGLTFAGAASPAKTLSEAFSAELKDAALVVSSKSLETNETAMIGGWSWSNIDVDDPRCTGIGIPSGRVVKDGLCRSALCVEQTEVGETPVTLYKKTLQDTPAHFHSVDALPPPFEYEEIPVKVVPIRVYLGPFVRLVEEGDTVQIDYQVFDAEDPLLEWHVHGSTFTTDEKNGTVTVTAPVDPLLFPSAVEAVAESTTGLREPSRRQGVRRGLTTLDLGELLLLPRGTCVQPGTRLQFEAFAKKPDEAEISWAPNGLVSSDGVFHAPYMRDHTFTVTATATYDGGDSFTEEADVRVSTNCNCWYSAQSYGDLTVSHSQKWGIESIQFGPRGDGSQVLFTLYRDDARFAEIVIERGEGELATGFYAGSLSIYSESGGVFMALAPDLIHLVRIDDRHILGRVTGLLAGGEDQWAMADVNFRFIDDAGLLASRTCYDADSYRRAQPKDLLDLLPGK